jgi:type VI secretion system secreted protein VgrG
MMHNKNVGVASTEQIGTAKIVSVGQVMMETIGHTRTISVGDQLTVEVGKSKLIMNKEGHVVILGTQFHFEASGPVLVRGKVIDHNP